MKTSTPESLLLKGVTIALPEGDRVGDIFVESGKIKAVGPSLNHDAELVIHEPSLMVLPGMIDAHVHFRDPGHTHKEDWESGSYAAAAGGVTTVFDMPNTTPATVTADLVQQKKDIAGQKSIVNYNLFIAATNNNLDELNGVENVAGIKLFLGSSTGNMLVNEPKVLDRLFANGKRLIAVHSEDENMVLANHDRLKGSTDFSDHGRIRTPEAALKGTKQMVALSKKYQRRLHILHLTTGEEADFIAQSGADYITTEVSAQHLLLHVPEVYEKWGSYAQINPPLREKSQADRLWLALKKGVIGMVASDHAPHTKAEKEQTFGKAPSGMPGVETSLPLLLTLAHQGKCSVRDVIRWMSETPARYYGIQNKGSIQPGYDADFVLVDLKAKRKITQDSLFTRCGWSAFEGWETVGQPVMTIVNGNIVFAEGDIFDGVKGREVLISQ